MSNKPLILVVEDDAAVRNLMAVTLETRGYRYHLAQNGTEALIEATTHQHVILLDLGLPDMEGIDIIRKVRSWSNMPIIVISARTEDTDKVEALDAGADDYLTKPFSVDELLARLRVALRRINTDQPSVVQENAIYDNGSLHIDYAAGCAYIGDSEIHLTPIEYKLLCLLAKNTGKVLTHNYILKEVWGSYSASEVGSLRVFMAMLRKKLQSGEDAQPYIQTHIGIGYRMLRQDKNPEETP